MKKYISKILLVDDNAFNLKALELILKPHIKYDILDISYDGESACDMVIK